MADMIKEKGKVPESLTLLHNMGLVYPIPNNYTTFTVEDGKKGDKLEKSLVNLIIIVRSGKLDANSFTSRLRNIFTEY